MNKKRVLFVILILSIFFLSFIIADEITDKVDKAYTCLQAKVNESCSALSSEEKIFSLLSVGECQNEVIADSLDGNCWPKSGCSVKTTAQAILALDNAGVDTSKSASWLMSQNTTPSGIDWFLEIESTNPATCTITYDSSVYTININADKKINSAAGICLSLSQEPYENYWLKVSPSCFNKKFDISCDESFLTTFLYKKTSSPVIYVSSDINSAPAKGTTTEDVEFSCFKQASTCNYEGSLWVTYVLNLLEKDISNYIPYLVTMTEDNSIYFPESFLYSITGDTNFRANILSQQINNKWWGESVDKFYNTSVALLPFQNEEFVEKTNTKNWLLENQDSQGCWQGNIRNTAFILYSIWPELSPFSGSANVDEGLTDCSDVGGYCVYQSSCDEINGSELNAYTPFCDDITKICCDSAPLTSKTCSEVSGVICSSGETCSDSAFETSDTYYCCTGVCESTSSLSECKSKGGNCKSSCAGNETETNDNCDYIGEICCVTPVGVTGSTNYWWIWLLLTLIILVILGIIFRDKLRVFWIRIKSKFTKKPPVSPSGFALANAPMNRPIQRRILPPSRQPMRKLPPPRRSSELDDILKKLKDI